MTSPSIRLAIEGTTGEIILDKPDKRNALSTDMWAALPGLLREAVADDDVKVIVLHGGTAGAFAAGADISEFETIHATTESAERSAETISRAVDSLATCPKPTISAIEGACVGGGVSLALATDIRIAGSGASFAVPPAKLGLVYPADDTRRLAEAVGMPRAMELLLTARLFGSEEAYRIGLVQRLVETGAALAAAREMSDRIGAVSQWSSRAIKAMFAGVRSGWNNTTPEAKALFLSGFSSEDFEEGYSAFLEKRRPEFPFRS